MTPLQVCFSFFFLLFFYRFQKIDDGFIFRILFFLALMTYQIMHLCMQCEQKDFSLISFYNYFFTSYSQFHIYLSRLQSGYSRFPVHENRDQGAFIGLLLVKTVSMVFFFLVVVVKATFPLLMSLSFHFLFCFVCIFSRQLLTYDPKMALPVSAFPLSILPEASPSINCFQALDYLYVLFVLLILFSQKGWTNF